jgi:glycoprotein-N-acetylgalactosamine 3-beta-galactosyltransferase
MQRKIKWKICFIFGFLLTVSLFKYKESSKYPLKSNSQSKEGLKTIQNEQIGNQISKEMRVFCWILGKPDRKDRWIHLKKIWGHKCDRFVVMVSVMKHIKGLEVIKLDFPEGRQNLWNILLRTIIYIHNHFINDYDYFMKVDDDT